MHGLGTITNTVIDERLTFDPRGLDPLHLHKQVFLYRNACPSAELLATSPSKGNCTFYNIIDNRNQSIFDAVEYNQALSRKWCSDLRSFELSIRNTEDHQEVLRFQRPFRGDCCFCFGFMQTLDILQFPEYAIIGRITQEWAICRPRFVIKLPNGEILFHILGACCTMRCCVHELNFEVVTSNKHAQAALISCQWTGLLRDEFDDEQFYGVEFHQAMDTKMKALILGACFLVNALYYKI